MLQKYGQKAQFIKLVRKPFLPIITFSPLIEAKGKVDVVLFIRDADGIATEKNKIDHRIQWYKKLGEAVEGRKTLLLNIYSLEALILADIDTFNNEYNTKIKFNREVSMVARPKEFLMQKTEKCRRKYSESHCPSLFGKLNFDRVVANCRYYREFNERFEKLIA